MVLKGSLGNFKDFRGKIEEGFWYIFFDFGYCLKHANWVDYVIQFLIIY